MKSETKYYRFLPALDKILGTKRGVRMKDGLIWKYYQAEHGKLTLKDGSWFVWPSPVDQQKEIWEVEPEVVTVWGACDNDGVSGLYSEEPIKKEGSWRGQSIYGDLFSKTEPQQFKLVPVEDE